MYPYELENYIKEHNYNLEGKSLLVAIDTIKNPQLTNIVFHPENDTYDMWDRYGNHYGFKANKQKVYTKKMNR